MKNEVWKDIDGYDGMYNISSNGRVKSNFYGKEKFLSFGKTYKGYNYVVLYKNRIKKNISIGRLVAQAFLGLDINYKGHNKSFCVCHKDDNPENNILDNLFLGTQKDNLLDMRNKNRYRGGKKTIIRQYTILGIFIMEWNSIKEASNSLGISEYSISKCINRNSKKLSTSGGFIWKKIL